MSNDGQPNNMRPDASLEGEQEGVGVRSDEQTAAANEVAAALAAAPDPIGLQDVLNMLDDSDDEDDVMAGDITAGWDSGIGAARAPQISLFQRRQANGGGAMNRTPNLFYRRTIVPPRRRPAAIYNPRQVVNIPRVLNIPFSNFGSNLLVASRLEPLPVPPRVPGAHDEPSSASAAAAATPGSANAVTPLTPSFQDMLRFLVGLRAGPIEPMPWQSEEWERLVAETMADTGGVKTVASEAGLKEVKLSKYSGGQGDEGSEAKSPEVCAITQMPFEEGDDVAEMPCGHKFDQECLLRWLKDESAACPICRTEVDSVEVSLRDNDDSEDDLDGVDSNGATVGIEQTESQNEGTEGQQEAVGGNVVNGNGGAIPGWYFSPAPHIRPTYSRRIGHPRVTEEVALENLQRIEREQEDDLLEAAILAAVMRESMNIA